MSIDFDDTLRDDQLVEVQPFLSQQNAYLARFLASVDLFQGA